MPTPAAELAVQKRMTQAFIDTRPETIVLTPMVQAPDGSGGRKKTPGRPRPPQQVRFIEDGITRSVSEIGTQYTQAARLLAMPSTQIAVDDEFTWGGGTWRVEEIEFPNEYEIRATILRYGRGR